MQEIWIDDQRQENKYHASGFPSPPEIRIGIEELEVTDRFSWALPSTITFKQNKANASPKLPSSWHKWARECGPWKPNIKSNRRIFPVAACVIVDPGQHYTRQKNHLDNIIPDKRTVWTTLCLTRESPEQHHTRQENHLDNSMPDKRTAWTTLCLTREPPGQHYATQENHLDNSMPDKRTAWTTLCQTREPPGQHHTRQENHLESFHTRCLR